MHFIAVKTLYSTFQFEVYSYLKEGDTRGGGGGTQYRNTVRKIGNTEIPRRKSTKYQYRMYDQLRLLKVTSIKRNGPASILSNLNPRLTGTKIEKLGHCKQQQSHCRSTAKNCINHVPCSRVFCVAYWVYWPILDRRAQMNGTAVPWRIFFYRIPSAKTMKKKSLEKVLILDPKIFRNPECLYSAYPESCIP